MPAKRRAKPPTQERLTKSALHYLDRYPSTRANLIKVLQRRIQKACRELGLEAETYEPLAETVADKCVQNGLVNDEAFAQSKTHSLRRRGTSRRAVEAKLSTKGVERAVIDRVLQDDDHTDQSAAVVFARRKRLGPFCDPAKRETRREKDLAAMCRAGFSFATARKIINANSIEDLDFEQYE